MSKLVNLYRAARLTLTQAGSIGGVAALGEYGNALARRRSLLESNLASGTIGLDDLGGADRRIVSAPLQTGGLNFGLTPEVGTPGDDHKSLFGLIGNLGEDMYSFGKGFFPGLYKAGKSLVDDSGHNTGLIALLSQGKSPMKDTEFGRDVATPTWEGTKTDIGNIAHGRWDELYAHPLNPLLTVASAASLGAGSAARGGSALSRVAGAESRLGRIGEAAASLTDPMGRAPVFTGTTQIDRLYSTRPLAKVGQRAFDAAAPRRFQEYLARTATQRREFVQNQLEAVVRSQRAAIPVADAFKELSPQEAEALQYMWGDIRTPNEVQAYADQLEKVLNGQAEDGYNFTDIVENPESPEGQSYFKETQRKIQALRGDIGDLIANPTPAMQAASNVWHGEVDRGRAELNLPDEIHNEMLDRQRQMMDEMLSESGLERGRVPDTGIEPTYAPRRGLQGLEWHDPNAMQQAMGMKPGLRRTKYDRQPTEVTEENITRPNVQAYLHASSGTTFRTGNYRVDAQALVDHVKRREKDLQDNVFKQDFSNKYSAKAYDPETDEYKTIVSQNNLEGRQKLRAAGQDPKNFVFVPTNGFERLWVHKEHDMLQEVLSRGHTLVENGMLADSPEFMQSLEDFISEDAHQFMRSQFDSIKAPGTWIPRNVFNYQRDLIKATDPFTGSFGKGYQGFINAWRRATLTWMPRWALNTAVGSFVQAMVAGAINPRDYIMAHQLRRAGDLPAGVHLGRVATHEMLNDPTGWLERKTGIKGMPITAEKVANTVQAVEDFFRGGVFIKQLRNQGRFNEVAKLEDMGEVLQDFYKQGLSDSEMVGQIIRDNPEAVQEALKGTDKFMYNYMSLGPAERRYVRQFIPFWGWYKFITKLTWRLPVEYPGRAIIMNNLAAVGNEELEELGPVPSWLQGSIMLNYQGGILNYLTGSGVNPFANFANPAALFGDTGQSGAQAIFELGQLSPTIQAGLSGIGVDPYSGGGVAVSPQSGYARDWAGNLVNMKTGEQVNASQVNPLQRFFMSLARSFPQVRLLERAEMGGATPYPESVPLPGMVRPMYTPENQPVNPELGAVLDMLGQKPRGYNLQNYQEQLPKRQEYAKTFGESQIERLRKKLQPTP